MTGRNLPRRMALDSSVVIFEVLRPNRLCYEWELGAIVPLISDDTARELHRKLTALAARAGIPDIRRIALERSYLRHCERVVIPAAAPAVPAETPPEDAAFVQLAVAADADALVTRDRGLLRRNGRIVGRHGRVIPALTVPSALQLVAGANQFQNPKGG